MGRFPMHVVDVTHGRLRLRGLTKSIKTVMIQQRPTSIAV